MPSIMGPFPRNHIFWWKIPFRIKKISNQITCDWHPRISGYIGNGLTTWSSRLWTRIQWINNGTSCLMVKLRRHRHRSRSGTNGTGGRHGRTILMVMAQRVIDHWICWCHITGQTGRIPARFIRRSIGGGGRCQCGRTGTRRKRTRYHTARRCRRTKCRRSDGLLLVMVVGGGGGRWHVRIHSGCWRCGRCATIRMLWRWAARWTGGAVVDDGSKAGFYGWGAGRTLEQLLMMELLMILG